MISLDFLFRPKTVALIGASHTEEKLGGVILKNLLRFMGRVYPVNPKYSELMGLRAYLSFRDIPEPVDISIIMRPASEIPDLLREHEGRAKCVIIMSSGFAEIGETGLQDEIKRVGREIGVRVLGPNCMGIYNPHQGLDTFFLPHERLKRPKKGNVAIVSQSGAVMSCIMAALEAANAGVSSAVGYGNAVDIDEGDLYEYLSLDKKTDVVISYIESVEDGRRFIQKARELSDRKPLLVLKAGKSEKGRTAAYSHTGRLAGRYEVFHSVIKQYGIQETSDFDGLICAVKALSYQRQSEGNRVCIITNGGGSGVLAADECARQGLDVADLPIDNKKRLMNIFPHFYGIGNPLDLTAQVTDEDYVTVLNELRDDYDGFIIIALANVFGITERLGRIIGEAKENLNKPIVSHIAHSGLTRKLTMLFEKSKIPVYPSPETAVRGLKALLI